MSNQCRVDVITCIKCSLTSHGNKVLGTNHICILKIIIGGFAKRAHPARARYLNVNLARRNRDLQPGGKEIEGGGRGGGEEEKEEKSDSW